jgi:peptide/nickel transport system substrate-binding protein
MPPSLAVRRRFVPALVPIVVLTAGLALPSPAGAAGLSPTGAAGPSVPGRVYRTAVEDFGFTDGFDPTGEYVSAAWGLYSELLLRTLLTYRHVAGLAGTRPVPDLATDLGRVSADGLTYTFTLKRGIRFGPPVSRPITSRDVEYAFERMAVSSLVAQYGFYFEGTIVGMRVHDGGPRPIPGIETPDDRTIVFHLTRPTGDFRYRLTLPATAPIPPEVGRCFQRAGDYGRDVVSSGPYMIQGADRVDASSCASIRPMPGFDITDHLRIVRNPDYEPRSDSPAVRENAVDGVDIEVIPDAGEIFRRIRAGSLDGSFATEPAPEVVRRYRQDPSLRPLLHANQTGRTWYVTMNLLTPPFDDVHVRRAMNWAMDKAALRRIWGGDPYGRIATHPLPPTLLGGLGQGLDPYHTPGFAGDVARARREMARSAYDTDGDGVCDAPACRDVAFVNRDVDPWASMTPVIVRAAAAIGIRLRPQLRDPGTAYTLIQTVKYLIPIAANPGWGQDYADPFTFDGALFHSDGIFCFGQVNYSEIGMTARQARECRVAAEWRRARPPSVDSAIDACERMADPAGRLGCWTRLEAELMRDVVSWVPYRWANAITIVAPSVRRFEFDEFSGTVSLCHVHLA